MTAAGPTSHNSPISCFTRGAETNCGSELEISGAHAVKRETMNIEIEGNTNNLLITTQSNTPIAQNHSSRVDAKYGEVGESRSPVSAAERQRRFRAYQKAGLKSIPVRRAKGAAVEGHWDLADYFSGDPTAAYEWAIETALAFKRRKNLPLPVTRDAKRRSILL